MTRANRNTWSNADAPMKPYRASSGLLSAVQQIVLPLDGVQEVRVLHRDNAVSKFFVILSGPSLETIDRVVGAMVQIEEKFDRFDYDTVPADRLPLIPSEAVAIGHA